MEVEPMGLEEESAPMLIGPGLDVLEARWADWGVGESVWTSAPVTGVTGRGGMVICGKSAVSMRGWMSRGSALGVPSRKRGSSEAREPVDGVIGTFPVMTG